MPEPNERNIEKLLWASSRKRREEAGSPEMPPATREILRTEVSRQYGTTAAAEGGTSGSWLRFLPRLAVLLVIAASAWILFMGDEGEPDSTLAMKNNEAPEFAAAEFDDRSQFARELRLEEQPATLPPTVGVELAAAPEPAPRASLVAVADDSTVRRDISSVTLSETKGGSVVGADYFKADRQGMYMGTAAVEREQENLRVTEADGEYVALLQPGEGEPSSAGSAAAAGQKPMLQAPLAQKFTLITRDGSLQIRDADGSTYAGTLEVIETAPGASSATQASDGSIAALAPSVSRAMEEPWLKNYRVVATGTNRTLGRVVQFEGELALTQQQLDLGRNTFSNTVAPVLGDAITTPIRQAFPGRLEGTALLEDGNPVRVEAVPVR